MLTILIHVTNVPPLLLRGDWCLKSNPISAYQNAVLYITEVPPQTTVTFQWRASSEQEYDFLTFDDGQNPVSQLSGNAGWQYREAYFPNGRSFPNGATLSSKNLITLIKPPPHCRKSMYYLPLLLVGAIRVGFHSVPRLYYRAAAT